MKKTFFQSIWFKILLTILVFIPPYTQISYNYADISSVTSEILRHPLVIRFYILLPISKLFILVVVINTFFKTKFSSQILLFYYAFILVVTGIFQNMGNTSDYGFSWLVGNTLLMIIVSAYCIYDIVKQKSVIKMEYINKNRLWVFIPMLLAFLMPYSVNSNNIVQPSLTLDIFTNESGLTYCMITPVIIGTMIIFSKGIYKPLLSVISYVGLIFSILNMLTWFIIQNQN